METFRQELELLDNRGSDTTMQAGIPTRDILTSVFGLGPIPLRQVINALTMVAESNRLTTAGAELSPAETATRSAGVTRAKNFIEKVCKGPAETQIKSTKSVMARINLLTDTIIQLAQDPLIGADGEQLAIGEARDQHDTLRDQVSEETANGSVKHLIRRTPTRSKELLLLMLDYPVFLLAMFSVFNVSLRLLFAGDGPAIVLGITAAVFALLGTLLYGYVMRTFGRRHRVFKNAEGGITAHGSTRIRIRIEQSITIAITAAAAAVMAMRIWLEGTEAEAPVLLIIALASLFAALLGVSGYINYMSEYENGSDTIDRILHLSAQLGNRTALLDSLNNQVTLLVEEAGIKIAALNRLSTSTLERAEKMVTTSTAEKAITLARSYHSSTTPVPGPQLISPELELVLKQTKELTAHHATLKKTPKEN
ncbi:hypothetical protein [Plantibacter sp. M259]|uniref:hypothetical protein n=1 Tax=Plantibacter sp. M259 TaxID=2583822 RepID=UPI00111090D0|nr:hypothetical protein [Plantibacter sp. M259]